MPPHSPRPFITLPVAIGPQVTVGNFIHYVRFAFYAKASSSAYSDYSAVVIANNETIPCSSLTFSPCFAPSNPIKSYPISAITYWLLNYYLSTIRFFKKIVWNTFLHGFCAVLGMIFFAPLSINHLQQPPQK